VKNSKQKIQRMLKAGTVLALAIGLSFSYSALPVSAQDVQPAYRYTKTPTVGSASSSLVYGLTTDSTGATYLAGGFNGTINFAGVGGNDTITTPYGTAYISKHGQDGTYAWTRSLDSSSNGFAQATGVVTDASNNVYVTGSFSGNVIFDGTGGSNSKNISGSGTFINKYTSDGTYLWTKTIIPPGNGQANANSIGLDAAGNFYVAGSFVGTVNFAGAGGTDNHTDAGGNGDIFVTRFNADGSYGFTRTFDTTNGIAGTAPVKSLVVDSVGDIYVAGSFNGSVDFAAGTGSSDTLTDTGGSGSSYVTKFGSNGNYGWTRAFANGSTNNMNVNSIAADPSGNVYIAGAFTGSPNFAGGLGSDVQTDGGGSGDAYITKLIPTGGYGWTKTFDTSPGGYASGDAVTTDINGDIYMLSGFGNTVNFAGISGNDSQTQNSSGAITMYAPDGSYRWTRTFDTTNGTAIITQGIYTGLAADTTGNLYAASVYSGTVGFDGSGGNDRQTAGGYGSGFLTSYKTFILDSITVVPTSITPASTHNQTVSVKAPDTGYGAANQNRTLEIVVIVSVALSAALLASRLRAHPDVL
jgi:hypothetical protein